VGSSHPEITPPSNFHHLRDTTVTADLPNFIDNVYNTTRLHSAIGYLSPNQFEKRNAAPRSKRAA
jgi:putative transposase